MARTTLTPQTISTTGTAPTYAAANVDGHAVKVSDAGFVHVKNGGGASITITLPTPGTVEGLAIADRTVTVPAAGERMFRPTGALMQPEDGLAHLDFSAVTSVTIAAFQV